MIECDAPLIGMAANSGVGKTTLLRRLIPLLKAQGLRLAVIKHAHHKFNIDYPGKDSYEIRCAGADQVLVASGRRWALMVEEGTASADPDLAYLLGRLDAQQLDLVLVEGFKNLAFPKIELYRPVLGKPPMYTQDSNIIAVATDEALSPLPACPVLDINDVEAIAVFIRRRIVGKEPAY